jgi:hypothetical protein
MGTSVVEIRADAFNEDPNTTAAKSAEASWSSVYDDALAGGAFHDRPRDKINLS